MLYLSVFFLSCLRSGVYFCPFSIHKVIKKWGWNPYNLCQEFLNERPADKEECRKGHLNAPLPPAQQNQNSKDVNEILSRQKKKKMKKNPTAFTISFQITTIAPISAEWKPQLIIIIIEEIEKSKIRKRAKSKASGASGDFHPRRPAIWTNAWLTKRTPEWGCRGLLEGYRACVLLARQLALCTGSSTFFNEVCLWISPSHA